MENEHNLPRPHIHYTPPKGWMNDPNGLIFHDGVYHLYYQHYPDACTHGPMHWGHAESHDLVHWQNLPIALYPDENGTIYSGSVVAADWQSQPALVAVYTCHKDEGNGAYSETQCLAVSTDGGHTYDKFEANPVLRSSECDFRDPKVFFYEKTKRWVMPLAVKNRVEFYTSKDLIHWRFESRFSNGQKEVLFECPDLCRVRVEDSETYKWVLLVSVNGAQKQLFGVQYYVGEFDGAVFTPDPGTEARMLDFGLDHYASVTFGGLQDRTVLLGWMSCWYYGDKIPCAGFRGCMTLPRELTLRPTSCSESAEETSSAECYALCQRPAREIYDNLSVATEYRNITSLSLPEGPCRICFEALPDQVSMTLAPAAAGPALHISIQDGKMTIDRTGCGPKSLGPHFHRSFSCAVSNQLELIIDTMSIEIFADGGQQTGTFLLFAGAPLSVLNSAQPLSSATVYRPEKDR